MYRETVFNHASRAKVEVIATTTELTNEGEPDQIYNCTIWNEALIQKSAGSDQKLVLELIPSVLLHEKESFICTLYLKYNRKYTIHHLKPIKCQ